MRYKSVSKNRVKIDFTLRYRMTRDEERWVLAEIQKVLRRIVHADMNVIEKVVVVHDYIVRTYDYEMQTDGSPFTVYTFMHEGQGVCMAYALLFEKMMEELHIPCYYVVGKADGESDLGHAWNMVEIDGAWYHIDATWNDLGKRTKHDIRYRYFLRSDEVFKRDHQWNLNHYPPCTSDRFDKMSALYDVAFYQGKLYGPHPQTGQLIAMDVEKLVAKKVVEKRVQHCMIWDNHLYFSCYDDGVLFRYTFETSTLEKMSAQRVKLMKCDGSQFIVNYETGEQLVLTKENPTVEEKSALPDCTVPFICFGDSYFASYEGKAASILFEAENGVQLFIEQPQKQVTVDLLLHHELDIRITSARKDVQLTVPAKLSIPAKLLGGRHVEGEVETEDGQLLISITCSSKLPIK